MLYKRPIIALTSLLDLLFILIFAYQMDIKSDADKYVQAEVEKRALLDIPDQRELVSEYKLQLENIKTQRDDLRNKLQIKERELVSVKQDSERTKKRPKAEGVIPVADKDAELTNALAGAWKGSDTYKWIDRSYRTTLNPDNSYTEHTTITANRDGMVGGLRLNRGESVSSRISGKWWVKGGYIHYFVEASNTKVFPIGHSSSSKIMSVGRAISKFKSDDGSISMDYRVDSN